MVLFFMFIRMIFCNKMLRLSIRFNIIYQEVGDDFINIELCILKFLSKENINIKRRVFVV